MNLSLLLLGLMIGAILMLYASYKATIRPYTIQKKRTMPVIKQIAQTISFGIKSIWLFVVSAFLLFILYIVAGWIIRFAN